MQGSYEPWVDEQRSYYREQCLRMLESLAGVAEKKQEWARSMDLAQRILRDDPFREDIHCLVMRAQAALGNRVAVKEQYETLRGLLQKELGVEPAAGKPSGEGDAGRGVHHLVIRRRPDNTEVLNQGIPVPARLASRLLTQFRVAGAAVPPHEAPEPARARLFLRR